MIRVKQYTVSRSYTVTEEIVMDAENYPHALSLCKSKDAWDNLGKPKIRESEYQHHKIIGVKK